jgi:phage tail-like protein
MTDQQLNTETVTMLTHLPAIYQDHDPDKPFPFLQFLEAFERLLLGREDSSASAAQRGGKQNAKHVAVESIGRKISQLYTLFDPSETPEKFLSWLGSWAALSIHANLSVTKQRKLLANIIRLYGIRGTRTYMEELLALCVDAGTSVSEEEMPPMQIGVHSTVGSDMRLGGGAPHFFRVTMAASDLSAQEVQMQRQIAFEVIELSKPAHTVYEFEVTSPELQVGIHSTVGVDTVLGSTVGQLP